MDNNNGGPPSAQGADWRTELSSETRENVVKRIMETHRKYVFISDQEGIEESRNIAQSFEGTTYDTAMSQSDYWKIITQWCLAMEATRPNSSTLDTTSSYNRAPGSQEMLGRVHQHWEDKVWKFCGFYTAGRSEIYCQHCTWGSNIYWQLHHHISGLGGGVAPCKIAFPWERDVGLIAVKTQPVGGVDQSDYRVIFDAFDRHESITIVEEHPPMMAIQDLIGEIGAMRRMLQEKLSGMSSNMQRKRARSNTGMQRKRARLNTDT